MPVRAIQPKTNTPGIRAWREIERTWLLPVSEPLDARIEGAGWTLPKVGSACERCGQPTGVGEQIDEEMGCASCRGVRLPWDRFVHLGDYSGDLGEWVREVKFTRNHWLGRQLGRELGAAIRSCGALGISGVAASSGVRVAPVATPYIRRLLRGIDHAGAIARGVAQALEVELVRPLKKSYRRTQRGLSATAREENMRGAFKARRALPQACRTLVVVDDICTTGATMRAACRAIRRHARRAAGKEEPSLVIIAAVVALATDPQRRRAGHAQAEPNPVDNLGMGVR